MKFDYESCIWWDLKYPERPNWRLRDRFYRFENSVFENFDPIPPPRQLMLHGPHDLYAFRSGEPIPNADRRPGNDDEEEIVHILDWQAWPVVAGQRIEKTQGTYIVFMSCAAKIYYLPAMMLNSLWRRTSLGMDPIDMFIPPRDAVLINEYSEARYGNDVSVGQPVDHQTWATEQLRATLNERQLAVVREYLALYLTWHAFHRKTEPIDFNADSVKEKIQEIERFIAWWDPD